MHYIIPGTSSVSSHVMEIWYFKHEDHTDRTDRQTDRLTEWQTDRQKKQPKKNNKQINKQAKKTSN